MQSESGVSSFDVQLLFNKAQQRIRATTSTVRHLHRKLASKASECLNYIPTDGCASESDITTAFEGVRLHTSSSEPFFWEQSSHLIPSTMTVQPAVYATWHDLYTEIMMMSAVLLSHFIFWAVAGLDNDQLFRCGRSEIIPAACWVWLSVTASDDRMSTLRTEYNFICLPNDRTVDAILMRWNILQCCCFIKAVELTHFCRKCFVCLAAQHLLCGLIQWLYCQLLMMMFSVILRCPTVVDSRLQHSPLHGNPLLSTHPHPVATSYHSVRLWPMVQSSNETRWILRQNNVNILRYSLHLPR